MSRPKLFRDPVHDIISLPKDRPEDRVLLALIECRELQRLRRIRQLGLTHLVYHGAEHSRFVHSMGVMWVARRMLAQLRPDMAPGDWLAIVAAALCHDVGHGPFSHVAERLGGFHHEHVTHALLTTPGTDLHAVLSEYDPALPEAVASAPSRPLGEVVSSQLDADRIDYILRDGLATGVKIGVFDVARILTMLEEHDGRLAVSFRALEAVEGYLLARFHMYKQVYLHKATRAAERMLEAALRRARHVHTGPSTTPLDRLVAGTLRLPDDVAALDDTDMWCALKGWAQSSDAPLARLASGLVHRHLYKTVPIPFGPEGDQRVEDARRAATAHGFDADSAVLTDSSEESPYSPYQPGAPEDDSPVRIVGPDGRIEPIERVSVVVQLFGRIQYRVRRLIVHPDLFPRLAAPDPMGAAADELAQPELPFGA